MKLKLSWTVRGKCWLEDIFWSELEKRITALYRRRVNAEAWVSGDRERVVGEVFKRDGRWTWWTEVQP